MNGLLVYLISVVIFRRYVRNLCDCPKGTFFNVLSFNSLSATNLLSTHRNSTHHPSDNRYAPFNLTGKRHKFNLKNARQDFVSWFVVEDLVYSPF